MSSAFQRPVELICPAASAHGRYLLWHLKGIVAVLSFGTICLICRMQLPFVSLVKDNYYNLLSVKQSQDVEQMYTGYFSDALWCRASDADLCAANLYGQIKIFLQR